MQAAAGARRCAARRARRLAARRPPRRARRARAQAAAGERRRSARAQAAAGERERRGSASRAGRHWWIRSNLTEEAGLDVYTCFCMYVYLTVTVGPVYTKGVENGMDERKMKL